MKNIGIILLMVLVSVSIVIATPSSYPASNPMGADSGYNFDSDSDVDFIGSHDGAKTGCSYSATTPFGSGKSLYCDGTDDNYFNTNFLLGRLDADFTICFWFLRDGAIGNNEIFFGVEDGSEEYIYLEYAPTLRWWQKVGADAMYITEGSDSIQNDAWNFLCMVNTGSGHTNAFMYNNASYRSPTNNTGTQGTTHFAQSLYFMAENQAGNDISWIAGYVDDILIFNTTALTTQQISDIYTGTYAGQYAEIDVDVVFPINDSGFTTVNITGLNHKMWVNITHNETGIDGCSINDSSWSVDSFTASTYSFLNNTPLTEKIYRIATWCNKTGTENGTAFVNFRTDYSNPTVDPLTALGSNTSVYVNKSGGVPININYTDNIEIYSINITLDNGTIIYDGSNLGVEHYEVNETVNLGLAGDYTIISRVCDAHTNGNIDEMGYTINNNEIIFYTETGYIKLYPKTKSDYDSSSIEVSKEYDRYSYSFKTKDKPKSSEVFYVESDYFIDVDKKQKYGGHLVIPYEEKGYWVDFESSDATDYEIKRISDTKIEVTVKGLTKEKIKFNSVGELNCLVTHYGVTMASIINISGVYAINGTTLPELEGYIDNVLNGTSTTGYLEMSPVAAGSYTIKADATGLASSSQSLTVTLLYHQLNFSLYEGGSINITFYNEQTLAKITDANITLEIIELGGGFNETHWSDATGVIYVDDIPAISLVYRFSPDQTYGTRKRHHYTTLTADTHANYGFYLIPLSLLPLNTSITVYNQITLQEVEDAVVYLQKRMTDNTYRTVSMFETGLDGKAFFEVERGTEYYKILVDYPLNTRVKETGIFYVEADNVNVYIPLSTGIGTDFFNEEGIIYSLNFNNNSNEFGVTYTDTSQIATQYCLETKTYGTYGMNVVDSSCSTVASATLQTGGVSQNTTYYATFYATINGQKRPLGNAWVDLSKLDDMGAGQSGGFLTLLIIGVFIFISQIHYVALIFGAVGLLFAQMLGLITVGMPIILTIIVVSIVISVIINMRR